MTSWEATLQSTLQGEVHADAITRHVYSVDASIFEMEPLGVVLPKTQEDLQHIVEMSQQFRIPLTARGAATGITGGCLGQGLIVDLSKYFTRILSIDIEHKTVTCQPGVIQDDLNRALAPLGYRLGPDTSTGNRATLGGMLANNAAGARSLRYGKMIDHIWSVNLLLSTGETLTFSAVSEEEWKQKCQQTNREGEIYRTLWDMKHTYADEIRQHFPAIPRRVSGYNLDVLLSPAPFNVAKLIAGSEGTLGIVTAMILNIVPKLRVTGLLLFFFDDMLEALRQVPLLLEENPLSLEMIDEQIITLGRQSPSMHGHLDWLQGNPKAILVFEAEDETLEAVTAKLNRVKNHLPQPHTLLSDPLHMAHVWDLRKAGLGILLSKRTYSRAIAFVEDISVPPLQLASFMEKFCAYLAQHGKTAGIYGHVGAGCMHIRPYLDLHDPNELTLMRQMMLDITALLLEYGGTLSGEHGDGWIRSWLNPKLYGETLIQAFRQMKHAFDPQGLMNPGKIVPTREQWDHLRANPQADLQSPATFLNFDSEGGFELAADLCNGNGLCRKKEGVMCPSFQVTNNEFHSTRARAQALRAIIHKRLPLESFTSQGLYDVMDLCISCKGCKTECPSQVDMAKFKSEFLYHYQEKHGYSLRSQLFGHIGKWTSRMSSFASFFNWMNQTWLAKKVLSSIGISPQRTLPNLAKQRFSHWFANYTQTLHLPHTLVLFNDTFTEFNHPQVGQAAVKLLNYLGYHVLLPTWSCCGRPALSKGLLPYARQQAHQLIEHLWSYAQKGYPIVGLEPSCLLTVRDDYNGLLEEQDRNKLEQVIALCLTLDEFLAQLVEQGDWPSLTPTFTRKVKVHGHCYQKALVGMQPTLKVLRAVPGFQVEEIHSGCCGMAGSFGYEKEHESISLQIGELHLFPAVRACSAEDWIIASGTSCRHQIQDGTGHQALHLAEALALHYIEN